jgi:UDP-N-acetylmuramoylalanine--D-glutamate ligase
MGEAMRAAGAAQVVDVATIGEAVEAALGWAQPDGVVLLSPAAPSFSQFANFEDRSRQFAEAVRRSGDAQTPPDPPA